MPDQTRCRLILVHTNVRPVFGRSLRIYLADGSPTGIRLAEIVNWTGQAIACPRTRVSELAAWTEVTRPGIYLLIEGGLGTDRGRVYVGEAENVLDRIATHLIQKEFWTEAVAFTSKDANLTRGHVRYLETRLIELASAAARYDIENANTGYGKNLPRPDTDAMEEYLSNLRIVLGALGHRILEPLIQSPKPGPVVSIAGASKGAVLGTPLRFEFIGLTARGYATDEGFTVLAGSETARDTQPSAPKHVIALREAALSDGSLAPHEDHLVTTLDVPFTSSSTAASFVAGSSRSGPQSWCTDAGVSLKELERRAAEDTGALLS